MRNEDDFIEIVIEVVNEVRLAKGHRTPLARDKAWTLGAVLVKRLKSKGWEITPPLRPPVGGVLMGSYKPKRPR